MRNKEFRREQEKLHIKKDRSTVIDIIPSSWRKKLFNIEKWSNFKIVKKKLLNILKRKKKLNKQDDYDERRFYTDIE